MKAKELSELLASVVDCSNYRLEFWDRATFRRSEHDRIIREGGEIPIVEIPRWKPESNWSIYLYWLPSTKRRVVREQFIETVTRCSLHGLSDQTATPFRYTCGFPPMSFELKFTQSDG